ncbi:MAG: TonB-dependent receptor [Gammaproteobacteria bacterium]
MVASLATAPAFAQKAQSSEEGGLQSVTVTARYTQEDLQTTPLAITAVSGADLEARQFDNVTDLGHTVPNLFITPGDANVGPTPTIAMRGVSAGDYSYAVEPAVGIYIDDVYHNTMFGSALDLNDLERVEVKRGPQGTLSGFANIAGTISLFSKAPKGNDTGYFSAKTGTFHDMEVKGAFDTTIAPDLFMRISGQSKKQNGYVDQLDFKCGMAAQGTPELSGSFPTFDNSAGQRGCKIGSFGGTDITAARAAFRWAPEGKLELNYVIAYSQEKDEAAPEVLLDAHPSATDNQASAINALLLQKYNIKYDNRFLPPNHYSAYTNFCRPVVSQLTPALPEICGKNEQGQSEFDTSLRADYDITDKIHLKAIAAYVYNTGNYYQNTDLSVTGMSQAYGTFNIKQKTGEVRLNGSMLNDRFNWVGGLFYLDSDDFVGGYINYLRLTETVTDSASAKDKSWFVHGEYKLTDKLGFSAGLRHSDVVKSYTFNRPELLILPPKEAKESHFDWLASLNYQWTDDLMVYGSVSTGSRPPGLNVHPATANQVTPFPGERLKSYESGIKTEFFEHKLRTNLTAFYSDYEVRNTGQGGFECLGGPFAGPPAQWQPLSANCGSNGFVFWNISVGKPATVKGLEFEMTAEPVRGLLMNLSGGYNKFESGVKTLGQPGFIFPGNFPQPQKNASGGIQYAMNTGFGTFTPRIDAFYTSVQTYGPAASLRPPTWIVPAHTVANAQVTYTPNDSKWSMVASATNIADKYYCYNVFGGSGFELSCNTAPPRMWFLSVKRDF